MGFYLAQFVQIIVQIYIFVIVVDVVLSYILPPYHRVREFLDSLVNPLLMPIRRVVPPIGMLDLSPLVLLLLVQLVGSLLSTLLFRIP